MFIRVVSFYRPCGHGLKFFKTEVYRKRGAFNYATEYWRNKYGANSFTVLGGK